MRHRAEDQVTLALIRHGETAANREHRYLGKTDEGLSERGKRLLLSRREQNGYPSVQYLFSSPMRRCRETAEVLYPGMVPILIPEWEEMDFGQFEYKNYEELKGDARYQAWIDSGGALAFPEGESREAFVSRCGRGFLRMCRTLYEMIQEDAAAFVSVGAVVHGGTIMALLSLYGGASYFDCQTACGGGYLCKMEKRFLQSEVCAATGSEDSVGGLQISARLQ